MQKKILALIADVQFPEIRKMEREETLNQYAKHEFAVHVKAISEGSDYLESSYDQAYSAQGILKEVIAAEKNDYSAVLLLCLTDPMIDACREAVDIPVIGAGQASFLTAASLASKFSVITILDGIIPLIDKVLRTSGCDYFSVASIRAINLSISEMTSNRNKTIQCLIEEGKKAILYDGAHAIVLGCTEMGERVKEEIEAALNIPIVEPNIAALGSAICLIKAGLLHSRKCYPKKENI
jgi:allantoin racemase